MREIQERLKALGFDPGPIDGRSGPRTTAAIRAFQTANGLQPDGIAGPRTLASLMPHIADANLAKAHPLIQKVMSLARMETEFRVLDSSRGKAAQEKAFRDGHSKAHFGQSAHNWSPAIAVDLFPAPYDWNNIASFDKLAKVVMRIAKEQNVPLRWGGDWSGLVDRPHYELHPWREFAKSAKPYTK